MVHCGLSGLRRISTVINDNKLEQAWSQQRMKECERVNESELFSEAAQIKSKIYNVLNIIKLDFPPLGLGTRLEIAGQWTLRQTQLSFGRK